jgi:two-component sensor histidine kinase
MLPASSASPLSPAAVPLPDAIAEANHRIANNLTLIASMVRMHARTLNDRAEPLTKEGVRALLEEIGTRIEQVAHLHGLMAGQEHGEPVDLSDYLRDIGETVVSSLTFLGKAKLHYGSHSECLVAPGRALPVGLIVGELLTNAVKYAHPAGVTGDIMVTCNRFDDVIVVVISDDGIGLPETFDPMRHGGLGLRLVRSLAAQVDAKLVFNDTGTGLSVEVHIPA